MESKNILKNLLVIFGISVVLALIVTAVQCQFFQKEKVSSKAGEPSVAIGSDNLPRFALFSEEKISITPSVPEYTIKKANLSNFVAVDEAAGGLSKEQIEALETSGFFMKPAPNLLADGEKIIDFNLEAVDEFLINYSDLGGGYSIDSRKPENAVFITSDLLLHAFHVFLDRTFQYIEQSQFHPKLLALCSMLFEKSLNEYQSAKDLEIKQSLGRLIGFFLVPKVILETSRAPADEYFQNPEDEVKALEGDENVDTPEKITQTLEKYKNQVPDDVYKKTEEEIKLINEAQGACLSPLFGEFKPDQPEDYSQYKPRSHYTKNSTLRSYWKAMIWFGRNGFLAKSDQLTLDAMIQALFLENTQKDNQTAIQLWENIYLPTVFFTGKADDLTVYDYAKLIKEIYGDKEAISGLADKTKFAQFKAEVKKLSGPQIQSSIVMIETDESSKKEVLEDTKSFRFMGQRFIPDSFIFSEMTQGDEAPDPETGQKLPAIPTGLMPMSIFGSGQAQIHLDTWIKKEAPDSDKVIAKEEVKLKNAFDKLTVETWTQNLYWSWLYTLKSLFQKFGKGYPQFMQTTAWQDKDLNACFGSWTELRHDTLLYAKQSYAEMGAGGDMEEPPVPKGYVEPNLLFLNRIIALAQMTRDGLEKNNVLPETQKFKIDNIIEVFKFYRDFAVKELQNEEISDEDFEKLRTITLTLNSSLTPPTGSMMKASEARAGLIADVHTAMTEEIQEVLYEATGIPNIIFVAVSDANGMRLTRGVAYSYYEFTHPFGERLSDQDWQGNIYEDKKNFPTPSIPDWVKPL